MWVCVCVCSVLEILFGLFHALKSKLQSSDFPSWYFQPHEGSQGLLSGDLGSWWGLETCIPGEVCSGSVILGGSLSFCSRFFSRSLEVRDVLMLLHLLCGLPHHAL